MRRFPAVVLMTAAAVSGCATTRVVTSKPGKGGVIAIHEGLFGDARADAKKKMKSNCGKKKPEITEEGEAKVGSHTSTNGSTKKGKVIDDSSSESDSTDKTEWRLTYKCAGK